MKKIILSLVLISSGVFAKVHGLKKAAGKVVSVPLSALIDKDAEGDVKVQFFAQCNTGTPLNISDPNFPKNLKFVGSFDNPNHNHRATRVVGAPTKTCNLYAKVFTTRTHKLLSTSHKNEVVKKHEKIKNLQGSNSRKDQKKIEKFKNEIADIEIKNNVKFGVNCGLGSSASGVPANATKIGEFENPNYNPGTTGARVNCVVYVQDQGSIESGLTGGDTGRTQPLAVLSKIVETSE